MLNAPFVSSFRSAGNYIIDQDKVLIDRSELQDLSLYSSHESSSYHSARRTGATNHNLLDMISQTYTSGNWFMTGVTDCLFFRSVISTPFLFWFSNPACTTHFLHVTAAATDFPNNFFNGLIKNEKKKLFILQALE